jgi:hypothetical protein
VTLNRQRAALLPVLNDAITVTRFSIYNKTVHPRFPLHGVKLKNTTGKHLMQGPAAVFEGGTYVGDTRLTDLQPDQERLLSYAMDLGVEVRDTPIESKETLLGVSVSEGRLVTRTKVQAGTTWSFHNRSKRDRSLLLEHPRAENWTLAADTDKPAETGREFYRFAWEAPAGKTVQRRVSEETVRTTSLPLSNTPAAHLKTVIGRSETSKAVKELLVEVLFRREKLDTIEKEADAARSELGERQGEQDRISANLTRLPQGSAAHKRALEKFDQLETQIEKLKAEHREKTAGAKKLRAEYLTYVSKLNAR